MNNINNNLLSNFHTQQSVSKDLSSPRKIKKVDGKTYGYVMTGTSLLGGTLGYVSYKSEKTKLQNLLQKTEANIETIKPKGLLEVTTKLQDSFVFLLKRRDENKSTVFPNCIMLEGPDEWINKELIEWTGENSNCKFVKLKQSDDLLEYLEKAEKQYSETRKWTLIHYEGLEKYLNPKETAKDVIAGFKDIIGASAKDYHSTIIFSTKDSSLLDKIAVQFHRVDKKIPVNINKDEYTKMKLATVKVNELAEKLKNISKRKVKYGVLLGLITGGSAASITQLLSKKNV